MSATSLSLLDRLRQQPTPADWQRMHDIYQPLILAWLVRVPDLHDEVADLAQEVMLVLVREVAAFDRQREGSFRRWLRIVTVNRIRQYWRDRAKRPRTAVGDSSTDDFLNLLADPSSDLAQQWDRDHDRFVFERLLDAVRPDFGAETWEAFLRFAVNQQPAASVAAELGTTANAVVLAKARVLARLREEAGALID